MNEDTALYEALQAIQEQIDASIENVPYSFLYSGSNLLTYPRIYQLRQRICRELLDVGSDHYLQ